MVSDFRILAAQAALEFEDTFVDGTDEGGPSTFDASEFYSIAEALLAVNLAAQSSQYEKVVIRRGALISACMDLARYRETISKIEETLGY